MKYKKINVSEITSNSNNIILPEGTIFLNPANELRLSDGVTTGGLPFPTDDIIFDGSTISTRNPDQDMTITTNGNGDVYIGADRNMIFDMNAWSAKGILIQDSQEDGYDNSAIPSMLKVGSIYHETGRMVIESDGRILDASGVVVDTNGDPSVNPVYGGLWIGNGEDTGLGVPGQSSTSSRGPVEIHNEGKVWKFDNYGILTAPTGGAVAFANNTALMQGTFDNNTSGQSGISLYCAVGYELNWQGGHLRSTADNGMSSASILFDSAIQFPGIGTGISLMGMDSNAITFPDGTTQSSANISSSNITDFNSSVNSATSGTYAPINHSHSSSDIIDFTASVSGLLPVTNIVGGSGISVNNNMGMVTINSNLVSDPTGITGATAVTNIVQISQADYNNLSSTDPNTLYIIT